MKSITIRFEDDVYEELKELQNLMPIPLNTLVNNCVRDEYQKFSEDPKIKEALEVLNEFQASLEILQKKLK